MSNRSRPSPGGQGRALLLVVLCWGVVVPLSARAATVRTGQVVTVGPQEVINDDLYVFAREVHVEGTVRGDVVAAGQKVDVTGTVAGDVQTAASETHLSGRVSGSVRAASNVLDLSGPVGKDAMLAANDLRMGRSASVGGDLFFAGNRAEVASPVKGRLHAAAQTLIVSAPVGGDVRAQVDTLRLASGAHVHGNLSYRGGEGALIDPGASVAGRIERLPVEHRRAGPLMLAYAWVRSVVGLFALGMVVALLSPRFARRAPAVLRQQPWKSLGWGAVLFFGLPVLAGGVFFVGALVGGWWLGLFVLAVYALGLVLAFPVVGMLVGQWLMERFGRAGASLALSLLVGLMLLMAVRWVPLLGGLVALATVLFGLGAMSLAAARGRGPVEAPT
ncbi:polymer-forming cytoskeletal protein [Corallococcus sp. M34]|uniref:polymer-forming cytoskeletal protein n=1 Tax=Citreicoccus inhibens TaxID=2849499 RepID=UPI0011C394BD|nr:polymer-forming cytoskeletal protein [Citreicoccus inhibens]MBU8896111.1 polymer-forming cytoskeletal protein [Citreicoccus inhibens]